MTTNNTGLAIVQQSNAIEPTTMPELEKLAKFVVESKFFGVENVAQATMLMLRGKDLGFSYAQACSAFHNIKGKLTLTADAMVAVCLQRRDLCARFRPVEQTETRATWEAQRVGDEPVRLTFTIEEARTAGLTEQNGAMWKKYPKRMLSARCKAFLARDLFPELLLGLLSTEEAQDIGDEPRHAAPAVRVTQPARVTHDADGVVIEDEDPRVQAFIDRMDRAQDMAALKVIGREVKDAKSSLSQASVAKLTANYQKQTDAFKRIEAERARMAEPVEAVLESPAPPAVEEVGA